MTTSSAAALLAFLTAGLYSHEEMVIRGGSFEGLVIRIGIFVAALGIRHPAGTSRDYGVTKINTPVGDELVGKEAAHGTSPRWQAGRSLLPLGTDPTFSWTEDGAKESCRSPADGDCRICRYNWSASENGAQRLTPDWWAESRTQRMRTSPGFVATAPGMAFGRGDNCGIRKPCGNRIFRRSQLEKCRCKTLHPCRPPVALRECHYCHR